MASLVLLNVPPLLIEEIKEWARQRHLTTDDAALALLRMAVEVTAPPPALLAEHKETGDN